MTPEERTKLYETLDERIEIRKMFDEIVDIVRKTTGKEIVEGESYTIACGKILEVLRKLEANQKPKKVYTIFNLSGGYDATKGIYTTYEQAHDALVRINLERVNVHHVMHELDLDLPEVKDETTK